MFSNDSDLISSERQSFNMVMKLRNDRTFTIDGIPGYKDSRLQALYEQKSVSELYQAFHRARPYGKTKVREVLLFTDVPVEDVPVDSFLEREGRLLDSLRDLVNGQGRATLRQLRKAVWESHSQDWSSRENIRMWTDRHLPWIVTASGTDWAPDPTKPDLGEFRTSSSST